MTSLNRQQQHDDKAKGYSSSSGGGGSDQRKEHIDLTSGQTRESGTLQAFIQDIKQLSPTIKGFKLKTTAAAANASFKAGQWVDFFIPGLDKIGGFSMCSEPDKLAEENVLELAVKFSTWGPAFWLHTKAEIGSQVAMRVGGDYHYPNTTITDKGGSHNLLLIGGGVGINPLASIFFHIAAGQSKSQLSQVGKVQLLYSASARNELIFRQDFDKISQEKATVFKPKYFVTKEPRFDDDDTIVQGRLTKDHLKVALDELGFFDGGDKPTFCFICGPTPMIQSVESQLESLGLAKDHIFYELWW